MMIFKVECQKSQNSKESELDANVYFMSFTVNQLCSDCSLSLNKFPNEIVKEVFFSEKDINRILLIQKFTMWLYISPQQYCQVYI